MQGKRERRVVSYEGAGGGEMADSDFEVSSADESSDSDEEMDVRTIYPKSALGH